MTWWPIFKKDDWRLVTTLSVDAKWERTSGKIYYHLYESRKGKRKVNIATTLSLPSYMDLIKEAKRFSVYQEKIYRWEMDRHDPDIPRYSQILEEDTANALKGCV
jgi:hypothetical protein